MIGRTTTHRSVSTRPSCLTDIGGCSGALCPGRRPSRASSRNRREAPGTSASQRSPRARTDISVTTRSVGTMSGSDRARLLAGLEDPADERHQRGQGPIGPSLTPGSPRGGSPPTARGVHAAPDELEDLVARIHLQEDHVSDLAGPIRCRVDHCGAEVGLVRETDGRGSRSRPRPGRRSVPSTPRSRARRRRHGRPARIRARLSSASRRSGLAWIVSMRHGCAPTGHVSPRRHSRWPRRSPRPRRSGQGATR